MSASPRRASRVRPVRDRAPAREVEPAQVVVRRALPSDFEPLAFFFDTALRRDYFIRRRQLREILDGRHHQLYVAELDHVLVGAAVTTRGSDLINVLVHPAYRGVGIGKALVRESRATFVRAKLDMRAGDPRGFYEALGFESTGQRNEKGNIEFMRLPASKKERNAAPRRRPAKNTPAKRK